MNWKFKLLPAIIVLMGVHVYAQDKVVKLWPDKPPGSISDPSYKETVEYNDQNSPRISRVTDPELLVFLAPPEKATGTAVVICPGGGYGILAIDHEGHQVAKWFNEMGVTGIILKYRLPSDLIMKDKSIGPLQDVQEAVRTVRRNAADWRIDPDKVGVMGFSAGGHLAGTASTLYNRNVYEGGAVSARPDFSILIYGVLSMQEGITHQGSRTNLLGKGADESEARKFSSELQIDANTPPAFLVHSGDDQAVPVENSIRYYQSLQKAGVPAELHIYEKGGHGYGLAPNGGSESGWPEVCQHWMQVQGWLK